MLRFSYFNDTATTEIYTRSLHDALPIFVEHPYRNPDIHLGGICGDRLGSQDLRRRSISDPHGRQRADAHGRRSEEHTSELQSRQYLVCRLLLEKKKTIIVSLPRALP